MLDGQSKYLNAAQHIQPLQSYKNLDQVWGLTMGGASVQGREQCSCVTVGAHILSSYSSLQP